MTSREACLNHKYDLVSYGRIKLITLFSCTIIHRHSFIRFFETKVSLHHHIFFWAHFTDSCCVVSKSYICYSLILSIHLNDKWIRELMFVNNSLCSTLDHPGKPVVSLALRKTCTQRGLMHHAMKRHIVSILHAMIMIHDSSLRIGACFTESYGERITRNDLAQ